MLPRVVHESCTLPTCLITKELKYAPIAAQELDPVKTPPPGDKWVWVDMGLRRPKIGAVYCRKIHKMVLEAPANDFDTRYTDNSTDFVYGGKKATSQPDPNQKDLIKLFIPNSSYATNILRLAEYYGSEEVIPALTSKVGESRSRFRSNGFLSELYRVPLSLYSSRYLQQTNSSYITVMENRRIPYLTNDPVQIPSNHPGLFDARLKTCGLNQIGNGEVVNGSDIIAPPLFLQQRPPQQQQLQDGNDADTNNNNSNNNTDIDSSDDDSDQESEGSQVSKTNQIKNVQHKTKPFIALEQFMSIPARFDKPFVVPPQTYIGSHSPPEHVQDIFYQMLFEHRARMVVALTLAEPYWPISGPASRGEDDPRYILGKTKAGDIQRFGHFLVKVTGVEVFKTNEYVIVRHIKIVHNPLHERVGENKHVPFDWDADVTEANSIDCSLLQYLDWPDMGTPEIFPSFMTFYQIYLDLKARLEKDHGYSPLYQSRPIVGHCLAGIGRWGSFVAIDIVLSHLNSIFETLGVKLLPGKDLIISDSKPTKVTHEDFSNLFDQKFLLAIVPYVILGLRTCRRGMVQTAEQVRFIARFISLYVNTCVNHHLGQN